MSLTNDDLPPLPFRLSRDEDLNIALMFQDPPRRDRTESSRTQRRLALGPFLVICAGAGLLIAASAQALIV